MRFRVAAAATAAVVLVGFAGCSAAMFTTVMTTGTGAAPDSTTGCTPVDVGHTFTLDQEQTRDAAAIIAAGQAMTVPTFGLQIALAVAYQEAKLRDLSYGLGSSVGVFQQTAGWGTVAQRMNVTWAARAFYRALLAVPGWQQMPLTVAAQAVQRSGYPDAYAQWTALAVSLTSSLPPGGSCTPTGLSYPLPPGTIGDVLRVALAQVGDPYVWGAAGPDAFDCSGELVYAYAQAGEPLAVRTAAQMQAVSTPLSYSQLQPGDNVFWGSPAHHVALYLGGGRIVEAPHTGLDVRVRTFSPDEAGINYGRFTAAAFS